MKSWQIAVAGLACLGAAGCRTDPNIALLERELRVQEDEIYRLRGVVEDYQDAMRSCRAEGGAAGSAAGESDLEGLPALIQPRGIPSPAEGIRSSSDGASGDRQSEAPPSPFPIPSRPRPGGEPPDGSGTHAPMQGPGSLDFPMPEPPEAEAPGEGVGIRPASVAAPAALGDSREVARLTFDGLLSGGYDADGRPGDDGIAVVLRTRDAEGRAIEAPADVSVVLLDPAIEGDRARVARWDFTAAETAGRFERTGPGGAMQLQMPWPADPPTHGELYLFARYTTADGRNLQAEGPIEISLPGETLGRWIAAPPAIVQAEASVPAELDEPARIGLEPIEPREMQPPAAIRIPADQSSLPPADTLPAGPRLTPPVWSPNRP